ncbi:MAG: hypothetical protein RRA94_04925 [Bacteroidota bacterium]|nr:hypothetical protein [Bacteroidota bacterium]
MKQRLRICALAAFLAFCATSGQAQTVVIVNSSIPSSTFNVKELLDLYTLNKTHWDDGSRVTVFDLKAGKAKQAFYDYIGMTEEDLQRIWLRKQFTGRARPPHAMSSEDELVAQVGKTIGGIGYASEKAVRGKKNVRIIAKLKE